MPAVCFMIGTLGDIVLMSDNVRRTYGKKCTEDRPCLGLIRLMGLKCQMEAIQIPLLMCLHVF